MGRSGEVIQVMGVLALELAGGTQPRVDALDPASAGELAQLIAGDLAGLVPEVTSLELTIAAAHFDPAEVLRPGWPLHRRLDELRRRAPGHGQSGRVIALGADAGGQVPMPLQSDPALHGGALRVLPFVLDGDPALLGGVARQLEEILLERGMAGAATALHAQQAFGARIEHARILTVHDLAAIVAMQYQHQGLDLVWEVIETALLEPGREHWIDQPPEPLLCSRDGKVEMALLQPGAWQLRHGLVDEVDPGRLARGYAHYQARQRQVAAVLEAHGLAVTHAYCSDEENPRSQLGG